MTIDWIKEKIKWINLWVLFLAIWNPYFSILFFVVRLFMRLFSSAITFYEFITALIFFMFYSLLSYILYKKRKYLENKYYSYNYHGTFDKEETDYKDILLHKTIILGAYLYFISYIGLMDIIIPKEVMLDYEDWLDR